ncbi:glycosyltransferase family 39 protein [Leptolyngbya cf. ectocarpi LEGE 11479]|uniref:Glycosyltransferase family 39 protein n=1 Tax=Leptolyngbya cf. ectocarpi LEGE 11479 TaxID=1828722 RepID=A0A928X1N2_LEPEC|nr:glycosyltransferase family 39 protein [Leptolyngbya ectocarpi]MBE9065373.1 glycosyltransferase family 39 protein [Leptolyngbya cf. ectocarpi LEGE 11479]
MKRSEPSFSLPLEPALMGVIGVAIALRFFLLTRHELWYDEALSMLLSSGQRLSYQAPGAAPIALKEYSQLLQIPMEQGLGDTIETIKNILKGILGDAHPPLFYLSQHVWMRLFGAGIAAQRSLVVLTGIGTIGCGYGLGRLVLGARGGLILAALLATNPFFLAHSLNLRMYALLTFWAVLSQWLLLLLLAYDQQKRPWRPLWLGLAAAVAGGLLTQYLYAYCLISLGITVLVLGRRHWLRCGSALGMGVLLSLPWVLWGTRQQANNRADVLNQISVEGSPAEIAWRHFQDIAHTLANHLLLGHWTTGLKPYGESIKPAAVAVGVGVIIFLVFILWQLRRERRILATGVVLGLIPLLVALGLDILTNKFTVGFGWGRSTIVALPGCLLLIASWLMTLQRWQQPVIAGVLSLYLVMGVGSFVGRDRNIFRTLDTLIEPGQSTLIVINSNAWGNVSRLAYHIDGSQKPVDILMRSPADLAADLEIAVDTGNYDRILFANTRYPVWDTPKTDDIAQALYRDAQAALEPNYLLTEQTFLTGTMKLDQFEIRAYRYNL